MFLGYLLLDGINDSQDHAKALGSLMEQRPKARRHLYHVNLMVYNPAVDRYARAPDSRAAAFRNVLRQCGVPVTVRHSPGEDIAAACGQLQAQARPQGVARGPAPRAGGQALPLRTPRPRPLPQREFVSRVIV